MTKAHTHTKKKKLEKVQKHLYEILTIIHEFIIK